MVGGSMLGLSLVQGGETTCTSYPAWPNLPPSPTLTRSPGSLLSIQRAMMTSHVALTGGRVAMKLSGRAWPLEVGGGSCMVGGRLGIQTQESN